MLSESQYIMAFSSNPTFVVFPGAFHTTEAFGAVKRLLEEDSYACILTPK